MIADFGIGLLIGGGVAAVIVVAIFLWGMIDWMNSGSH